jgi:prophage antirepressor-like protein
LKKFPPNFTGEIQIMSNLSVFVFESQHVRFVGTPEKPEWVAADIVAILYPQADSRNYSNYLSKVLTAWKGHKQIMTPGGQQKMATLYEPGLYYLIGRSDSPIAVPFQEWLYEDVLPSIRRTGKYEIPQPEQHHNTKLTLEELLNFGQKVLAGTRLSPELQTITVVRGVQALYPEIAPMAKELVGAIQEIEATPDRHLSPTAIGELYAERQELPKPIKPQIVNRALEAAGLQSKEIQIKTNSVGKQCRKNIWNLTEAGKRWGTVTRDKARTHDKIVEHVRWLPDVLEVIDLSIQV